MTARDEGQRTTPMSVAPQEADGPPTPPTVTDQHSLVMDACVHVARTALSIPDDALKKARRTIEAAESVGPFLEPTAYREGAHRLPAQRKLLDAIEHLRATAREITTQEGTHHD